MQQAKKYVLTDETRTAPDGTILRRIRAEVDIPSFGVKKGDLGGFVQKEDNLSHDGNARVSGNAQVQATSDYLCLGPVGSHNRYITVTKSNGKVSAGCFLGTLDEFEEAVGKKYPAGSDYHASIVFMRSVMETHNGKNN